MMRLETPSLRLRRGARRLSARCPGPRGLDLARHVPAPVREGQTLVFRGEQGVAAVAVIAPEIVRVRFSPAPAFGRDHSYAVVRDFGATAAARSRSGPTQSWSARARCGSPCAHDPFRIAFATAAGESLDEDDPARGIAFVGRSARVWKRLRDDEHVYGFGEKTGRSTSAAATWAATAYAMWNSDTFAYDDDTDPIYASVPFYMVLRKGRAHGIFFDNTFRSLFDVGQRVAATCSPSAPRAASSTTTSSTGPRPRQVVERYTALTGRMPLPPRWALGYHQCRYSYYPEAKLRCIADTFRVKRIPADVLWLDIHYLDGYNPFTWDRERFPDPARMIGRPGAARASGWSPSSTRTPRRSRATRPTTRASRATTS